MDTLLQTAISAAHTGGAILREQLGRPTRKRDKGDRDFVTEVDLAVQKAITNHIRAQFPEHGFWTEEDDASLPRHHGTTTWVIDPIDGTSNFMRTIPLHCVSVGVLQDGEPVVGVIYEPQRNELFYAASGRGAWRNDERIHTGNNAELGLAMIGLEWSRSRANREATMASFVKLLPHVYSVRSLGSAALALAYVACGRLDMYFNVGLHAWDVVAGAVLLQEAGAAWALPGRANNTIPPGRFPILATNAALHKELLGYFDV